jgi:hypothetical protein
MRPAFAATETKGPVELFHRHRSPWRPDPLLAAMLLGGSLSAGYSGDVELIKKLAAFEMTRGAIANYRVRMEAHTLDLVINPTTPLPTGEAGIAGRKTCALGAQDLAAKLTRSWKVRVFVDSQAIPVFSCEIATLPARARAKASAPVGRPRLPRPIDAASRFRVPIGR